MSQLRTLIESAISYWLKASLLFCWWLGGFSDSAGAGESMEAPATLRDGHAHLCWLYCPIGMVYSAGRCLGTPSTLTWVQANLELTRVRQGTGQNWRLPRVEELSGWIKSSAARGQQVQLRQEWARLDNEWAWSSTVSVDLRQPNPYNYSNIARGVNPNNSLMLSPSLGWAVNLADGRSRGDVRRMQSLLVVLVQDCPTRQ